MEIQYPAIGICGLSCQLCPNYHTESKSKCDGCKSESRMSVGCPFITCAVKRKGIEFCWRCDDSEACEKWREHREYGKKYDTFVCYQKLEENIAFVKRQSIKAFEERQEIRERLLREMLQEFNEGRSKRYYCIAATVMEVGELEDALTRARAESEGMTMKERSKVMHAKLDEIAEEKQYYLKLRKRAKAA